MIFQQFNLVPRKSVLTNVLLGALGRTPTVSSLLTRFAPEERARALEYLDLVGLADKANARATELSGGQQQRVAAEHGPCVCRRDAELPAVAARQKGDARRRAPRRRP